MKVQGTSENRPSFAWPRLLAALAGSGGFDALLLLEVDGTRVRVSHASRPHEALVGCTCLLADTPWADLADSSSDEPMLRRGLRKRFPDDRIARAVEAESAVAIPLEPSGAGRQVLVATSASRWRKPGPRVERLAEMAPVVASALASEAGAGLDRVVHALTPAEGDVDVEACLRALAETVEARYGLLVEVDGDDPAVGIPRAHVDREGTGRAAATLPHVPLAALRGRWSGEGPAAAAWLPGERVGAASGRELRAADGRVFGAVAVYHDGPVAWTQSRERALDVFAALAAAKLAPRASPRPVPLPEWPGKAPDRGGFLRGDLGPRLFAFDAAVQSIAELLRPGLPDDVALSVHAEAELALVKVDPVRFQRCVRDVLQAAIELPGVRQVRVVARHRRLGSADEVDALARPKDGERSRTGYASITVAAEGDGLDERTEASMLAENALALLAHEERGYLLGRRESRSSRSLELLLPTAQRVAVFRPGDRVPRAPAESVSHRRPLALVVDDEEGVRRTLTRLLGSAGARTVVAPDGLEALDEVRRLGAELDLVFLDVRMPGLGGVATLRAIRAAAPDLPIVLMSGYAPTSDERQQLVEMADAFLSKPFSLDEVRRLVSDLVGRRGAVGTARPEA